jgi:hypothetical protein
MQNFYPPVRLKKREILPGAPAGIRTDEPGQGHPSERSIKAPD